MLFLVWSLIKGQGAAVHWTYVGLLLGVNPQMIEQVVPLSENLPTVGEVTREEVRGTARARIKVFHMRHFPSGWNMYFAVEYRHIYTLSDKAFKNGIIWQFKLLTDSSLESVSRIISRVNSRRELCRELFGWWPINNRPPLISRYILD